MYAHRAPRHHKRYPRWQENHHAPGLHHLHVHMHCPHLQRCLRPRCLGRDERRVFPQLFLLCAHLHAYWYSACLGTVVHAAVQSNDAWRSAVIRNLLPLLPSAHRLLYLHRRFSWYAIFRNERSTCVNNYLLISRECAMWLHNAVLISQVACNVAYRKQWTSCDHSTLLQSLVVAQIFWGCAIIYHLAWQIGMSCHQCFDVSVGNL